MILEFFSNIKNDEIFNYIVITIVVLFVFTRIINIQLGHILALIISCIIIILLVDTQKNNDLDFNTTLEYKLNSLSNPSPSYLHLDANLINVFYLLKQDFYSYNELAYTNALHCVDNLLKIRYQLELNICEASMPPDYRQNYITDYKFKDTATTNTSNCNSTLKNSYENFRAAETQVNKCMNYLHTFIYSIPVDSIYHNNHAKVLDKTYILLKRNLDIIKRIHESALSTRGIDHTTKFITDYDLPKAKKDKGMFNHFT